MTKKIFSLILALSVVLCTFAAISPVSAATNTNVSIWDGKLTGYLADGTTAALDWFNSQKDNSVIEIYEARQLSFIAYMSKSNTYSGKTIKLMTDIDLDNHQWLPICDAPSDGFRGTFDGNGHTIKNLKGENLNSPSGYTVTRNTFGLIGVLEGIVKNLIIENVTYDLDLSTVVSPYLPKAGAICGTGGHWNGPESANPNIQNCAVKNVTFNIKSTYAYDATTLSGLAAVCGIVYRATTIKDTYAKNVRFNFESTVANFHHGGFANHMRYTRANFINCYLADAKESVANGEQTDLRFGYFQNSGYVSMTYCYTTSNTTEPSAQILTNSDAKRIVYGMTSLNLHPTGSSYSADTANKNGGFPLLTMEAVPVYNLTITKNGDKFTASAVFNDVPETTKLFIAAYDKTTDMLVFADAIDSSIAAKEISDYDPAKHVIRAFVWDIADYTPLVDSVTYTE